MQYLTPSQWASQLFGKAKLGDPRRTRRLTQLAGDLSENAGASIVKASQSDASIEAAYRFVRNEHIQPESIAEAGFTHTSQVLQTRPLVLAIQDTTELSYSHNVTDELGNVNCSKYQKTKKRSLHVHSTLVIDAQTERTIGLANQEYWFRKDKNKGTEHALQARQFEDKETSVWLKCFNSLKSRVDDPSNIIDVCDRGADIYEYLDYHNRNQHRFVIRAKGNRKLIEPNVNLLQLCESALGQCCYTVDIQQRGGRKARQAHMTLHYQEISLSKPKRVEGQDCISLNVIICQEKANGEAAPLRWILYTSEAINSAQDAQRLVRYYELRWRIEEFHKVWKSDGTNVENLRLQRLAHIKRIAIIQAFVAVRLQQLQEWVQDKAQAKTIDCNCFVSDITWRLLWKKIEKGEQVPKEPPSLYWFYYALAKLGGWYDSKRNGRVGVKALWQGWGKLGEMVESAEILISLQESKDL